QLPRVAAARHQLHGVRGVRVIADGEPGRGRGRHPRPPADVLGGQLERGGDHPGGAAGRGAACHVRPLRDVRQRRHRCRGPRLLRRRHRVVCLPHAARARGAALARAAMTATLGRWAATLLGTAGFALALGFGQLLVGRTGWRLDLSPERRFVLSEHARHILDALEQPVELVGFLRADDPRNHDIQDLLGRVQAASPQVTTRLVDLNRNPALAREYGVDAFGSVVVENDGLRRDVSNPTEQNLMAAIIQVTRPARRRVYFSGGYGERRIADRDRQSGFTAANVALINELYEVGETVLDSDTPVPDDAMALIVAAPRRDLSAGALRQIEAYLRRGGGVLVLLEPGRPAPNLAALLRRYGIAVTDDVVLDDTQRMFAGDYLTMI